MSCPSIRLPTSGRSGWRPSHRLRSSKRRRLRRSVPHGAFLPSPVAAQGIADHYVQVGARFLANRATRRCRSRPGRTLKLPSSGVYRTYPSAPRSSMQSSKASRNAFPRPPASVASQVNRDRMNSRQPGSAPPSTLYPIKPRYPPHPRVPLPVRTATPAISAASAEPGRPPLPRNPARFRWDDHALEPEQVSRPPVCHYRTGRPAALFGGTVPATQPCPGGRRLSAGFRRDPLISGRP